MGSKLGLVAAVDALVANLWDATRSDFGVFQMSWFVVSLVMARRSEKSWSGVSLTHDGCGGGTAMHLREGREFVGKPLDAWAFARIASSRVADRWTRRASTTRSPD
jgi:hypothetical protein